MSGTGQFHTLRVEYTDSRGRRWCAVCRLPHTNARARAAHEPPTADDPTKMRILREEVP